MATEIVHPYITINEKIAQDKPIIKGTRTRVANIIAYYKLGYSPEELVREFSHLTLSQIHDALSYYYENMDKIDREIDDEKEENLIQNAK